MSADLLAADDPGWLLDRLVGATVLSNFRPDPPPPGPGREQPRRPEATPEGAVAPVAGRLIGARARSWPRRATCDHLIPHPRDPLTFNACVLSPGHAGTHLPAPRKGR